MNIDILTRTELIKKLESVAKGCGFGDTELILLVRLCVSELVLIKAVADDYADDGTSSADVPSEVIRSMVDRIVGEIDVPMTVPRLTFAESKRGYKRLTKIITAYLEYTGDFDDDTDKDVKDLLLEGKTWA